MELEKKNFMTSCVPETIEVLIILVCIELGKIILVTSKILVLIIRSVSRKTELETLNYI